MDDGSIREMDEVQELLSGIMRSLRRMPTRKMLPGHITFVQMRVLWLLESRGPCTMGEVAQMLSVTRPTATSIVNRLVAKGFVGRERSKEDRRFVNLRLRPKGMGLLTAKRSLFKKRIGQMLKPLKGPDRKRLLLALKVVSDAMQGSSSEEGRGRLRKT